MIAPKAIVKAGKSGGSLPNAPNPYSILPKMTLGAMGNLTQDNCEAAAMAHWIQYSNAVNGKVVIPTDEEVLEFASPVTGYVAGRPYPAGPDPTAMLNWWKTNGFAGVPLTSFTNLNTAVFEQVLDAIFYYSGALLALNLPTSAATQWSAGQPWTVASTGNQPGSYGGHMVLLLPPYSNTSIDCLTWGGKQTMDIPFFNKYTTGGYVLNGPSLLNSATGLSVNGDLNAAQLQAGLSAV